MGVFEQLGSLALATRLKLLGEFLAKDVANLYRQLDIPFEPRWFTLFWALKQQHSLTITELAQELKQTHAAAVQLTNLLEKRGLLVSSKDKNDERRRQVSLSQKGIHLFEEVEPILNAIEQANTELLLRAAPDFLINLKAIEEALEQKSMHDRILEKLGMISRDITIKTYTPAFKDAFYSLNRSWITEHFGQLDDEDVSKLELPEKEIIRKGGTILFALHQQDEVVGSIALQPAGKAVFRLSNFTVRKSFRKKGVGKALFEHAKSYALSRGASSLILYTNPVLVDSINFLIKCGFYMAPLNQQEILTSQRLSIKMILNLQD